MGIGMKSEKGTSDDDNRSNTKAVCHKQIGIYL